MCVLGVEGSEKKCGLPEDNFWNSPNSTHRITVPGSSLYGSASAVLRHDPSSVPDMNVSRVAASVLCNSTESFCIPFAPLDPDHTVLKLSSTSFICQLPSSVKQHASCSKASEHARSDPYAGLFLMLDSQLHYLRMQWMLQGEADPLNHHLPPLRFP